MTREITVDRWHDLMGVYAHDLQSDESLLTGEAVPAPGAAMTYLALFWQPGGARARPDRKKLREKRHRLTATSGSKPPRSTCESVARPPPAPWGGDGLIDVFCTLGPSGME